MDFSLRRSLAQKANILPANTPEDAKFASLGNIYSIRGTIGAPKEDANKTALGLIAAQGVAGAIGDENVQKAVGVVGNIFGGTKSASANQTGAATNAPLSGVLDAVGGIFGNKPNQNAPAKGATNAPATNAPAKNPIGGFLRAIQGDNKN
jgi:hypothetical protein